MSLGGPDAVRRPDRAVLHPPRHAPQAVVFDMDGLLLDSERLVRDAFLATCDTLGLVPDLEAYALCIGATEADAGTILRRAFGVAVDYADFERLWSERYHDRIRAAPVELKPGAVELLETLHRRGIPRGLATSTRRPLATRKLADAGILSFFACLICGGETARGKPHPDPYLAALACLGIPAGTAWALEDSANGVRSAHAAGLAVLQVPDLIPPSDELLQLGHRVAADLHEVRELLDALPDLSTLSRN